MVNPDPYAVTQAEARPLDTIPDAVAAEYLTLRGAIEDHRPVQISPSGKTSEMLPVFPVMPSAVAVMTGRGDSFAKGPSIGYSVAVVEQPEASAESIARNTKRERIVQVSNLRVVARSSTDRRIRRW